MGTKGWIIFGVLTVAVLGGLVYMSQSNRVDVDDIDTSQVQPATEQSGNIADHTRGAKDSKNVLVEYADFQCPHCREAQPHVDKLVAKYADTIAFVYRDFPLSSMFPNAKAAASAAEAAGLQGKFWDMHAYLFEHQDDWGNASASDREGVFVGYAKSMGLDGDKFQSDYNSDAVKKKIDFNVSLGSKDGVSGTPTFFFNGNRLPDEVLNELMSDNFDAVKDWLDQYMK